MSATQRAFLRQLAELLPPTAWEGDALQVCIFNAARLTPIDQPSAFKAIYRVLLDRDNGPKAGNFLSFLERDFVVRRCLELPLDLSKFWEETGLTDEAFEQWLAKEKPNLTVLSAWPRFFPIDRELTSNPPGQQAEQRLGIIEFLATMSDGKTHCRRVRFDSGKSSATSAENQSEDFNARARQWIEELEKRLGIEICVKA